jgi:hypothetical protein
MFAAFLTAVAVSFGSEVLLQVVLSSSAGYSLALVVYELANLAIVGGILYVFRPQEYSAFFFMQRTNANAVVRHERRPATTLELVGGWFGNSYDDKGDGGVEEKARLVAEVEILPPTPRQGEVPRLTKMAILREPSAYSIGVSGLTD